MGFPRYAYNKIHLYPSYPVFEIEEHENKNGEFVTEPVDQNKTLPKVEMFDLKKMMDAGVNMEEVNSKIYSVKTINFDKVVEKYNKNTQVQVKKEA